MIKKIRNFKKWWNRPKSELEDWIQSLVVFLPIFFLVRTWGYGLYQVPTGSMETTMLVGEFFFADKLSPLYKKPQRGEIVSFNDPTYPYSENKMTNLFQHYIWGPESWTKRVIGIPGDHIEGKIEDGKTVVYLNGQKLDEPYLNQYPLVPCNDRGRETWRSYDPGLPFEEQYFYKMNGLEVKRRMRLYQDHNMAPIRTPGMPLEVADQMMGSDEYDVHLGENEYWMMGDDRLGSFDSRGWGPLNGSFIHGRIKFRFFSLDRQEEWLPLELLLHPIDFFKRCRWSRCFNFVK